MNAPTAPLAPLGEPQFFREATELATLWRAASIDDIMQLMKISRSKAEEVASLFHAWSTAPELQTPAIDTFRGDIYSGLQAHTWSDEERTYAHAHLTILSGLYGTLQACDGVMPYRLEMGYKLPDTRTLYQFWGDSLTRGLPRSATHILNLSAVEYTKAILPFTNLPTITPKFLTVNSHTGAPTFVTVHTKIARGACANWVVKNRVSDPTRLPEFNALGYAHDAATSTPTEPVFVCQSFEGTGLSVRTSSSKHAA